MPAPPTTASCECGALATLLALGRARAGGRGRADWLVRGLPGPRAVRRLACSRPSWLIAS